MSAKPHTHADSQRILAALMGLHRAFPLERRIQKEACEATRETYLAVLSHWMRTGAAPSLDGFDREAIDELIALDALHVTDGRIGGAPFSVGVTDIQVHFPHETLYALSALDALAMSRSLGMAGTIETACAMSGEPVRIAVTENGELRAEDADSARVAFQKVAETVTRYALDLAPGIRFVLPHHAGPLRQTLPLPEAVAVANAFYAFQRKLLRGEADTST